MNLRECLQGLSRGSRSRDAAASNLHRLIAHMAERYVRNQVGVSILIPEQHRDDMVSTVLVKLLAESMDEPMDIARESDKACIAYVSVMLANAYLTLIRSRRRDRSLDGGSDETRPPGPMVFTAPEEVVEGTLDRLEPLIEKLVRSRAKQYREKLRQDWADARALLDGKSSEEILMIRPGVIDEEKKRALDAFYKRQQRFREGLIELVEERVEARELSESDREVFLEDIQMLRQRAVSRGAASRSSE